MIALAELMSELKMAVMTKIILSLLLVGLLMGCSPKLKPYDTLKVDPENLIDDRLLELAVTDWLHENHKSFTLPLTLDDLDMIRELELIGYGITITLETSGRQMEHHLSEKSLQELSKLKNLNQLTYSAPTINESKIKIISGLQQLTVLKLETNSAITDEYIKEITKLKRLIDLDISANIDPTKTTDAGLQELASLENLHHLDIFLRHQGPRSQVLVTTGAQENLRKALPKCGVSIQVQFD